MQIGVGSSEEIDEPEEAVAEALMLARRQYGAGQPQVVIVFASFHFDQQALLQALHAALGDIPMPAAPPTEKLPHNPPIPTHSR